MKSKEIAKITFDYYSDISRRLYLVYTDFVYFYRAGLITPSKKVEASKYELDKPYCRTYIAEDYMKGRVIKLYNPNKGTEAITVNPLTGEEITPEVQSTAVLIDDVSDEAPEDELFIEDDDILDRVVKNISAIQRFAVVAALLSILYLGAASVMFVLNKMNLEPSKPVETVKAVCTMPNIVIGSVSSVLTFIFAIVLLVVESKREKAIENFCYLKEANTEKVLTIHEEERVHNLSGDIDNIRRLVSRENKLASFVVTVLLAVAASVAAILAICTVSAKTDVIKFTDAYANNIVKILVYAVPAFLGVIFGLLIKKKGLIFAVLMSILVLASVAAVIFIFGLIA